MTHLHEIQIKSYLLYIDPLSKGLLSTPLGVWNLGPTLNLGLIIFQPI